MRELDLEWRRVPRDGGNAHPHQVAHAVARPSPEQDDPSKTARAARAALLEHQRFKARPSCSTSGRRCAALNGRARWRISEIAGEQGEPEVEVDLFSLLTAFRASSSGPGRGPCALPTEQISIESRIEQLFARLSETEACGSSSSSQIR